MTSEWSLMYSKRRTLSDVHCEVTLNTIVVVIFFPFVYGRHLVMTEELSQTWDFTISIHAYCSVLHHCFYINSVQNSIAPLHNLIFNSRFFLFTATKYNIKTNLKAQAIFKSMFKNIWPHFQQNQILASFIKNLAKTEMHCAIREHIRHDHFSVCKFLPHVTTLSWFCPSCLVNP